MCPVRMDLSGGAGEIVPANTYLATVSQIKKSPNKIAEGKKTAGSTTFGIMYKLDGDEGTVWDNFIIHPSIFWRFEQLASAAGAPKEAYAGMRAIGFSDEFDDDYVGLPGDPDPLVIDEFFTEHLKGAEVMITVAIEDQGRGDRNVVKKVSAPTGGGGGRDEDGW